MEKTSVFMTLSKLNGIQKLGAIVAVFIGIILTAFVMDTQGLMNDLDAAVTKEENLRAEFLDKKKQAVNLPAHKKQLVEIQQTFGELLQQLPNKAEVETLLRDINQVGLSKGLEFEVFRPAATERKAEFYAEQPVQIRVLGSFHRFGGFAEDVSRLSRIVNIDDINLAPHGNGTSLDSDGGIKLSIEATARTYRYLDLNETKKNRKSANK